ncbi:MAG: squalene/phytoene synthase family protein [Verrucomicrobiae bacterium]|nr:squalene/phytoene synthase family protein [Verrucomicrobiae bacterium]NNJ43748.1 squalene/phytoene synthase family protein [Akkermansiaceae bacterium]
MCLYRNDVMNPLGQTILKDVSRSFYLSMRVLPKTMRDPISLGYLLARASDTLADTGDLDASLRFEMLTGLRDILHGADSSDWLRRLERDVIPRQQHVGEKSLLEKMHGVLAWLESLREASDSVAADHDQPALPPSISSRQHAAILTVMDHILRGQRLDIERFELQQGFQFSLDAELDEYCFLVAGSVGEFWTEIGAISLGEFSHIETAKLKRWGANYGKGLQLINILRDLPSDLKAGRCYLPHVDATDRDALMAESLRWRTQARRYLEDGQSYAQSLVKRRIRAATALPGLIGERTLDLMDAADWYELEQGVKISRREVYRSAWDALIV